MTMADSVGALQYELNVAEIAAQSIGLSGLRVDEMSVGAFVTIALVMTVGIIGGIVCCILFLKKYLGKIQKAPKKESNGKPGFGAHATTAMFVGLCAAYIGSYIGKAVPREGSDWMPLFVAVVAAAVVAAGAAVVWGAAGFPLQLRHCGARGWNAGSSPGGWKLRSGRG